MVSQYTTKQRAIQQLKVIEFLYSKKKKKSNRDTVLNIIIKKIFNNMICASDIK